MARRVEARQAVDLRQFQVVQQRARRRDLRPGEAAISIQAGDIVGAQQAALAVRGVELHAGQRRQRGLVLTPQFEQRLVAGQSLRQQQFVRLQPGESGGEADLRQRLHRERAGGDIDPGEAVLARDLAQGGQKVVLA